MKNNASVYFNGINVSVYLNIQSKLIGKIALSGLIFIVIFFFSYLLSSLDEKELISAFIPILIVSALIIYFPVRYLLWNLFGKETLIISRKTVSFNYDYGFYSSNLKTIPFQNLATKIEIIKEIDHVKLGKLILINYNEATDLPELLHETTILIPIEKLEEIDRFISELFYVQEDSSMIISDIYLN